MRAIRWKLAGVIGLMLCSAARADERHDRDALERYQAQMSSILDNAFDQAQSADCYAAIAYSPKTGEYGYAFAYSTRSAAVQRALSQCRRTDARIVGWARNGWCALAKGQNNEYGAAWGATPAIARAAALRECRKHTHECEIVMCVSSR